MNQTELKSGLENSLEKLKSHIEKESTDAHQDFYPEKIDDLQEALDTIEKKNVSFDILIELKSILGFERFFPLVELAEKPNELENSIFGNLESVCNSYVSTWGIKEEEANEKKREYKKKVERFVLEGVFRKGLSETDEEIWRKIRYSKSGRTIYKYIYDIHKGWLHEDLVYAWLKEKLDSFEIDLELDLNKAAHDSDRVFKYNQKDQPISGEPDLRLECFREDSKKEIQIEVQHVTDRTRKKRKNLIKVPDHRVSTAKKYEEKYILIAPYSNDEKEVPKLSVIPGPLEESSENKDFVKAKPFVEPTKGASQLEIAVKSILKKN